MTLSNNVMLLAALQSIVFLEHYRFSRSLILKTLSKFKLLNVLFYYLLKTYTFLSLNRFTKTLNSKFLNCFASMLSTKVLIDKFYDWVEINIIGPRSIKYYPK